MVLGLCAFAGLTLFWPAYRAFLNVEINGNEGWNAYYADAAMGRMPLYPAPDRLITNNYPPLSFYGVGVCGRLLGDNVLAGRLISLASLLALAVLIACIVRELGGSWLGGCVGGACWIATMCLFFDLYMGMNEPQLLALAFMAFGFLLFLKASARGGDGLGWAIFVMVAAGFFKHNIVALPFAALAWLALQRRWAALGECLAFSLVFVTAGFAACGAVYGRDFFTNFLAPRCFSWDAEWTALTELQAVAAGLLAWLAAGWLWRAKREVRLLNLVVLSGLAVHFLQRAGDGVDINSGFDLALGVAMAVGWLFSRAGEGRPIQGELIRLALLLALGGQLAWGSSLRGFPNPWAAPWRAEIARRETLVSRAISQVRATPGEVDCDLYIGYKAGKDFIVDSFNLEERVKAGGGSALPELLARHQLVKVEADSDIEW